MSTTADDRDEATTNTDDSDTTGTSADETPKTSEYDNAWKAIVEMYFQPFLEFFFPHIAEEIDWENGYTFMEQELRRILQDAKEGNLVVDKLVQVSRKNGSIISVLIHIEFQNQKQMNFSEREFIYFYRLRDHYKKPIVCLAVLGDERRNWRPNHFEEELWGCHLSFTFPIVKIADYLERWDELEASTNPFATVIMAHLKTQETRQDIEKRKIWKLTLAKRLYPLGYSKQDIVNLQRFLDWIMKLPDHVEQEVWQEVLSYEEEIKVNHLMSLERLSMERGRKEGREEGREEGRKEGRKEGEKEGYEKAMQEAMQKVDQLLQEKLERYALQSSIRLGMKIRFGSVSQELLDKIQHLTNTAVLQTIVQVLETQGSLDDIRKICDNNTDTDGSHPVQTA
jgi:hypothetical protein